MIVKAITSGDFINHASSKNELERAYGPDTSAFELRYALLPHSREGSCSLGFDSFYHA